MQKNFTCSPNVLSILFSKSFLSESDWFKLSLSELFWFVRSLIVNLNSSFSLFSLLFDVIIFLRLNKNFGNKIELNECYKSSGVGWVDTLGWQNLSKFLLMKINYQIQFILKSTFVDS